MRQSLDSVGTGQDPSPGPGSACGAEMFDSTHVPATPPATPPSDQEKTTSSPQFPSSTGCSSSSHSAAVSPGVLPDAEEHDQQRYHINQRAAAVHAMAYAQACHAMQSFISRTLPLPLPQHNFQVTSFIKHEI